MGMRVSSILLSGFAVATLISGFSAQASEPIYMQGASAWSITYVGASQAGGDSYCALSRSYQAGDQITFAQNDFGHKSIAISLSAERDALLDVDSVALSSGFDLPVTFDITPLNDRAFVLKLPDQAQILDAAEESGLLAVTAGDVQYDFDLSKFSQGLSQLGACLGQNVANVIPPSESVPLRPAPTPSVDAEVQSKLDDMQLRIDDLTRENSDLRFKLANSSAETQRAIAVGDELSRLQQDNKDLRTQIMLERERHKEDLDAMATDKDSQVSFLRAQIADLGARVENTAGDVLRLPALDAQLFELTAKNDAAQKEISLLRSQLSGMRARAESKDQGEIMQNKTLPVSEDLRSEKSVPEEEETVSTQAQGSQADLAQRLENLESAHSSLKSETVITAERLAQLERQNQSLMQENAAFAQADQPVATQSSYVPSGVSAAEPVAVMNEAQALENAMDMPEHVGENVGDTVPLSMPSIQKTGYYTPSVMPQTLLGRAGLAMPNQIALVDEISDESFTAYRWQIDSVYGSSEHRALLGGSESFDQEVKDYLLRTQARCSASFAVLPMDTLEVNGSRIDSYDIACVGNDLNATAALLFFDTGGSFTALAHEASSAQLDQAMEARDRVVNVLKKL